MRKEENRTRSELVREALRRYIESRYPTGKATPAELAAIHRGREAFKRGEYVTLTDLVNELEPAGHQTRPKKSRKISAKRTS